MSNSDTVVPTSPVPVMVCAAWLTGPPGLVIATAGATVSTVSVVEVGAGVAGRIGRHRRHDSGTLARRRIDVVQWPLPSTVTAAPFTVSVEPIIRGATDLDAASRFRRVDVDLSPPSIGRDRNRRRARYRLSAWVEVAVRCCRPRRSPPPSRRCERPGLPLGVDVSSCRNSHPTVTVRTVRRRVAPVRRSPPHLACRQPASRRVRRRLVARRRARYRSSTPPSPPAPSCPA